MAPFDPNNNGPALSYNTAEILGKNFRLVLLHRKPLLNAETMLRKGQYRRALEIYTKIANKLHDKEVKEKLSTNIEEIKSYLKETDPDYESKLAGRRIGKFGNHEFKKNLRELTQSISESLAEKLNILDQIDSIPEEIPVPEPVLPADLKSPEQTPHADKKKSKSVSVGIDKDKSGKEDSDSSEDLSIKLKDPKKAKDKEKSEEKKEEAPGDQKQAPDFDDEDDGDDWEIASILADAILNKNLKKPSSIKAKSIETKGEEESSDAAPIDPNAPVQFVLDEKKPGPGQISTSETITSHESGIPDEGKKQESANRESTKQEILEKETIREIETHSGEGISSDSHPVSDAGAESKEGIKDRKQEGIQVKDTSSTAGYLPIGDSLEVPEEFKHPEGQEALRGIPGAFTPTPVLTTINEWLSSLFYSPEWSKFRGIPFRDRRSGKDRRTSGSNVLPKGIAKDRRTKTDRRKADLFKEREEFLKRLGFGKENVVRRTPADKALDPPLPEGEGSEPPQIPIYDSNSNLLELLPNNSAPQIGSLPDQTELEKVNLPSPEDKQVQLPKLDQNEIQKEPVSSPIAESLPELPANEEIAKLEEKGLLKINLPDPEKIITDDRETAPRREISGEIEISGGELPEGGIPGGTGKTDKGEGTGSAPYRPEDYKVPEELIIALPDPQDLLRAKTGELVDPFEKPFDEDAIPPEINVIDSEITDKELEKAEEEKAEISEIPEMPAAPPEPERMIHGILELKPPEIDDAPFLTLTYDFSKIPHSFRLSKNYSIMEYSYYKYKPMLMKAQEFARRKMLKNALNYYRVIKAQNIPPELKKMINRNITDITEFLEKFTMSKGG